MEEEEEEEDVMAGGGGMTTTLESIRLDPLPPTISPHHTSRWTALGFATTACASALVLPLSPMLVMATTALVLLYILSAHKVETWLSPHARLSISETHQCVTTLSPSRSTGFGVVAVVAVLLYFKYLSVAVGGVGNGGGLPPTNITEESVGHHTATTNEQKGWWWHPIGDGGGNWWAGHRLMTAFRTDETSRSANDDEMSISLITKNNASFTATAAALLAKAFPFLSERKTEILSFIHHFIPQAIINYFPTVFTSLQQPNTHHHHTNNNMSTSPPPPPYAIFPWLTEEKALSLISPNAFEYLASTASIYAVYALRGNSPAILLAVTAAHALRVSLLWRLLTDVVAVLPHLAFYRTNNNNNAVLFTLPQQGGGGEVAAVIAVEAEDGGIVKAHKMSWVECLPTLLQRALFSSVDYTQRRSAENMAQNMAAPILLSPPLLSQSAAATAGRVRVLVLDGLLSEGVLQHWLLVVLSVGLAVGWVCKLFAISAMWRRVTTRRFTSYYARRVLADRGGVEMVRW
eukprot:GHVS01102821.1.p1 GENE.GHVS01102821.1~~GHVS01102821.1.p1  ORF type:complete len:518 (-),score=133.03 GHVS01102821.1:440-1993(-)